LITLLPHCGYLSETSRMLEIHQALRRRGVPARLATHGGTYEYLLGDHDRIEPHLTPERSREVVQTTIGSGRALYTDTEIRTFAEAEADYFRAHGTRAVVTGFTLTAHLSSRLAGIPLVTEHGGSWIPPVFERGLMPAPVPGPFLPRTYRLLPKPLRRKAFNLAAQRARYFTGGFNRVAAALGVQGVPSLTALLNGDLTLVPESPEILGIPAADLDAWRPTSPAYRPQTRLRATGPLYAHLALPVPDRVADFLTRPGPLVYVAITSAGPDLTDAVVAALAPLPVRVLVAGTTRHTSDRVLAGGVLPSHEIMPHADLAITAGGQGSVQTAMATGTPLLGLPLQPEQDLNLGLVERRGAARHLAPAHAGTGRLTRLARHMLREPRYRDAAQTIQRHYATLDGPAAAATAILDHLGVPDAQVSGDRR
jgi:UDP:flavonoid glycosyltransferase YjiC (YdhE family)